MKRFNRLLSIAALAAGIAMAGNIPSGTTVSVRTTTSLTSATAKTGDHWNGTLEHDVKVGDDVVAHKGDPVEGTIENAVESGRLSKPGSLSLSVTSIAGQSVTTGNYVTEGKSHKTRDVAGIGGTSALGAIIGGVAGGGKGAAIGAGAGAGVGAAGTAATGKKDVTIPSETVLKFTVN